jgi:hypothetical protein
VARVLKTIIPIAGSVVKATVDEALLKEIGPKLELMDKITSTSLKDELGAKAAPNRGYVGTVSEAEGASLRELHALLMELDTKKCWGGLRRTLSPTGEYLWLCPEHFQKFEPGLPTLPYASES